MNSEVIILMTKEIFLELNIEEQIEFLNKELKGGKTVAEIRKELGIGEKKLQKILKQNKYKYNQKTKKYESSSVVIAEKNRPDTVENEKTDNRDLLILINEINELKKMNTKVVEMYEWYTNQLNVIEPIELKIESRGDNSTTTKSYKIYSNTEKKFQEFCKEHKQYKVQDLISKALDEFIDKYK